MSSSARVIVGGKWNDTSVFRPAALQYENEGYYTNAPYQSKQYQEYWREQIRRSLEGYRVDGVKVTGYHYWFMNFSPMNILKDPSKKTSRKILSFPLFWNLHFEFFHALEKAEKAGKHWSMLKPRGTGFSEIFSSMGTRDYSLIARSKSFYFASNESYLNKDGVLTKVWDKMEFLNKSTGRALRHLRQVKNQDLHRRASHLDGKGDEVGYMSEIIGRVIDHPRKVRGARTGTYGKVYIEEGGSFPRLKESVQAIRPLVEQGGVVASQIVIWGCVCAGTKVWTAEGKVINIEDLQKEEGIIGHDGKNAKAFPIIQKSVPVKKQCYRINLVNGVSIECSEDHPLLWSSPSMRSHGLSKPLKLAFNKACKVSVGDKLYLTDKIGIFGNEFIKDARLLGLLIGDGYYGDKSRGASICNCDKGVMDFIEDNYNPSIKEKGFNSSDGRRVREYYLKPGPKYRDLLLKHGMHGQTKSNKRLPVDIYTFNKDSLSELIGGYFDADGSVKVDDKKGISVVLSSISYELLDQVRYQLIKFGIHSSIVKENPKGGFGVNKGNRHLIYRLYINRYSSVINFHKNIKFLCEHKQDNLNKILLIKRLNLANDPVTNSIFLSEESNGKGASFAGMNLNGITPYRVKGVEKIGLKLVYNLTAGEHHNYLVNNIVGANTGGEKGKGITGLEDIFMHPRAYNMFEFDNIWDKDRVGSKCGYFFPTYAAMDRYTDEQGNCNEEKAKKYHEKERAEIKAVSPRAEDLYLAEYPFNPSEALTRLSSNLFPVAAAQRQLTRIRSDEGIQGFLKYGWVIATKEGLRFRIDANAKPLNSYPNEEKDTTGCVTMVESPYKDQLGKVPQGMYSIVLDMYYKDEATQSESLGAAYVYKHINNISESEHSLFVAWYVARPKTTAEFIHQLFMLARFYNAPIQSEIAGGGKAIIDHARIHHLLHLCELEPDIILNNQIGTKRNKQYFMNMNADMVNLAYSYYSDHLKEERSIKESDDGEIIITINLDKIYDEGILEEIIKFNDEGNFDRLCAARLLPFMIKERINIIIEASRESVSFWDRPFFTDHPVYMDNQLRPDDIARDIERTDYNS